MKLYIGLENSNDIRYISNYYGIKEILRTNTHSLYWDNYINVNYKGDEIFLIDILNYVNSNKSNISKDSLFIVLEEIENDKSIYYKIENFLSMKFLNKNICLSAREPLNKILITENVNIIEKGFKKNKKTNRIEII